MRLVGALLDGQADELQVTRRYMCREVLAKLIVPDNPQALVEARKAASDGEYEDRVEAS